MSCCLCFNFDRCIETRPWGRCIPQVDVFSRSLDQFRGRGGTRLEWWQCHESHARALCQELGHLDTVLATSKELGLSLKSIDLRQIRPNSRPAVLGRRWGHRTERDLRFGLAKFESCMRSIRCRRFKSDSTFRRKHRLVSCVEPSDQLDGGTAGKRKHSWRPEGTVHQGGKELHHSVSKNIRGIGVQWWGTCNGRHSGCKSAEDEEKGSIGKLSGFILGSSCRRPPSIAMSRGNSGVEHLRCLRRCLSLWLSQCLQFGSAACLGPPLCVRCLTFHISPPSPHPPSYNPPHTPLGLPFRNV